MSFVGAPVTQHLPRSEGDTNDVLVTLTNDDGTPADVLGWTAVLSVSTNPDTVMSPPKQYTGTGVAGGKIPINMAGFDVPIGDYFYDILITDTVTADQPQRVYFKGKFKVTPRIN